jgi:cysteinyl-tRNA synthetase
MTLVLHNTQSGQKEVFTPQDPENVTMYVCGPTVYNPPHIGNARPAVVFDLLYRLLKTLYPRVTYARNITDIDDKINKKAWEAGLPFYEISQKYARIYNEDLAQLGVLPPDIEPYATAHIPQIIDMIEQLIHKGHAYEAEGHVLFDVTSFPDYGRLSHRKLEDMLEGARVEVAPYKKNPGDFVLWKPSDETVPGWDSPWGYGRPGWHIECSAMCREYFGDTIDIHGGGRDLVFPHHENECAQSCCASGQDTFARYWLHNGMLNLGKQKMSKSLGNVLQVRELVKKYPPEALRWLLLSGHYRQNLEWSEDNLEKTIRTLNRIYATLRDNASIAVDKTERVVDERVKEALCDDLNTPIALAEINRLAKELAKAGSLTEKKAVKARLLGSGELLGLLQQEPQTWFAFGKEDKGDAEQTKAVEALIEQRKQARAEKNWAESDRIRDQLKEMGVVLEDSSEGTRWHWE